VLPTEGRTLEAQMEKVQDEIDHIRRHDCHTHTPPTAGSHYLQAQACRTPCLVGLRLPRVDGYYAGGLVYFVGLMRDSPFVHPASDVHTAPENHLLPHRPCS
jgi:hypothetical protein